MFAKDLNVGEIMVVVDFPKDSYFTTTTILEKGLIIEIGTWSDGSGRTLTRLDCEPEKCVLNDIRGCLNKVKLRHATAREKFLYLTHNIKTVDSI